jgi:hypothetical protein
LNNAGAFSQAQMTPLDGREVVSRTRLHKLPLVHCVCREIAM